MSNSPMVRRVGQVAINVQDVERASAFYRDILGIPFIWSNGRLAFLQCGEVRLLLERAEAPEFDHRSSILYLDVEDIDRAFTDFSERGVEFIDEPHRVGDLGSVSVWMAFFRDGEGNTMALQCERSV